MICHRPLAALGALAASVATLFVTEAAHAGPTIGGDLDLAFPIDSRGGTGGGFGVRLGDELHVPLVALTPELGFTYHNLSGDSGPSIYRGIAGLRLGLGEIVRPGAFAHIGYGHFVPMYGPNKDAFTWDVGGFLDVTVIPLLNVGVHVAYNQIDADYTKGSYSFLTLGLDAALVF